MQIKPRSWLLRPLLLLFVSCLALLPLSACSDGAGAWIRYDITGPIDILDPQYAYSEDAKLIVRNAFEGLFAYDGQGGVVPAAASGYAVSGDGLTYTINLREGLFWSDGTSAGDEGPTPVTAHDFEFALKRMFNPDFPSAFASDFSCIKNAEAILAGEQPQEALGVRALGERTLEIVLEYPAPYLTQLLCATAAMPCNQAFFEETRGRYGLNASMLLYNGPFTVRLWEPGQYLQLRPNGNYYAPQEVAPARLTFYLSPPDQRFERLRGDKTDVARLSYEELQRLPQKGYQSEQFEDTVWVLLFNQQNPFLQLKAARLALAGAVNHTAFAPTLAHDLNDSTTFLPPSLRLHGKTYRQLAGFARESGFAPQQAMESLKAAAAQYKAAMAQAGRSQELPALTLLTPEGSTHPLAAGAVQKNWRDYLALNTNVEQCPAGELAARVENGDYDIALYPMRPSSPRPEEMLGDFHSASKRNYAHYSSPQYDALLDSIAQQREEDATLEALMEAENWLYEDAVVVPMYFQTSYYVTGPAVSGIRFSPFAGDISFKSALKS